EAETGNGIETERMAFHDPAVPEMQPHRLRLGDQVADGEHEPVVDHDSITRALGSQRFRGEGVVWNDGVQADDRRQHAIEIERVFASPGLKGGRHFPLGQGRRGHCGSPVLSAPRCGDWRTLAMALLRWREAKCIILCRCALALWLHHGSAMSAKASAARRFLASRTSRTFSPPSMAASAGSSKARSSCAGAVSRLS